MTEFLMVRKLLRNTKELAEEVECVIEVFKRLADTLRDLSEDSEVAPVLIAAAKAALYAACGALGFAYGGFWGAVHAAALCATCEALCYMAFQTNGLQTGNSTSSEKIPYYFAASGPFS